MPSLTRPTSTLTAMFALAWLLSAAHEPAPPGAVHMQPPGRDYRVVHGWPVRSAIVIVSPDGSVLGRFGRFGVYDGQFYRAHDLAMGKDGAVYVGDAGFRVQKFVPR